MFARCFRWEAVVVWSGWLAGILLECIGIVSLHSLLSLLLLVLSRPSDSSPPRNTKESLQLQLWLSWATKLTLAEI